MYLWYKIIVLNALNVLTHILIGFQNSLTKNPFSTSSEYLIFENQNKIPELKPATETPNKNWKKLN